MNLERLLACRGPSDQALSELAAAAGVSRRSLVNARYGHNVPNLRTVDRIAKALGVPAHLLLFPDIPLDVLVSPHYWDGARAFMACTPAERETIWKLAKALAAKSDNGA